MITWGKDWHFKLSDTKNVAVKVKYPFSQPSRTRIAASRRIGRGMLMSGN